MKTVFALTKEEREAIERLADVLDQLRISAEDILHAEDDSFPCSTDELLMFIKEVDTWTGHGSSSLSAILNNEFSPDEHDLRDFYN